MVIYKNAILLLSCAIAAILSAAVNDPFHLRVRDYASSARVLSFDPTRVERVEVGRGAANMYALERAERAWKFVADGQTFTADKTKVESALVALDEMHRHQLGGDYPAFGPGMAGNQAMRVVLLLQGGQRLAVWLGEETQESTYVRANDETKVFFVRGNQRSLWTNREAFQERRLHPRDNLVRSISIKGPYSYSLAPASEADPSRWKIDVFNEVRAASPIRVRLVLQELERMEGESFVSNREPRPYGTILLQPDREDRGGANRIDVFQDGGEFYVKSEYNSRLMTISERQLKMFFRDPSYFFAGTSG